METGEGDGTYVAAGVTVVRRKDRQSAERWVGGGRWAPVPVTARLQLLPWQEARWRRG